MANPLLKGVYLRGKIYYRNINIRLSNGKYTKQYFCLDTSDIKDAIERNREIIFNEDKIKSGVEYVPTWRSHTGTFRFKSYEFGYLSKKFMEFKRGEGITESSLDFYRLTFDLVMDIQNYFDTGWKADLDMTRMNDEHIEDIKRYFMMRVNARETGINDIKGIARPTVSIRYRNLRTFFNWLVDKEVIKKTPKLVIKGIPPKEPKLFTDSEMDIIYDHILNSKDCHNYLADIYRFYAETGLRLSEPIHATLTENILTVRKTKGNAGRGRKVALESHQIDTLKTLKKKHTKGYYSKKFHKIITQLGIKNNRSFHNLRDTWITKTWYLTGDIHLTSKLVGHSTISMTQVYCGFHPDELESYFPSIKEKKVETQKILQAMKEFELNPYKVEG